MMCNIRQLIEANKSSDIGPPRDRAEINGTTFFYNEYGLKCQEENLEKAAEYILTTIPDCDTIIWRVPPEVREHAGVYYFYMRCLFLKNGVEVPGTAMKREGDAMPTFEKLCFTHEKP